MAQVNETVKQEDRQPKTQRRMMLEGALSFTKLLLSHPTMLRQLRVMGPDEERYVRPPLQYEIPPFHDDMRYSTSNEQYLRPTNWCNPHEPEVIAMANELGAYELLDKDFVEAAYDFAKNKLTFEMCPMDGAGATLTRGTGTCWHLTNVFVTLCRSAGIKARYKTFAIELKIPPPLTDPFSQWLFTEDLMIVAEGEVCLDGTWMVAYVALSDVQQASQGLPISKLGEDAIGILFDALPGTIVRSESIPLGFVNGFKFFRWLMPASMERTTVVTLKAIPLGEQAIKEAGGVEAYDQKVREKLKPLPIIELEPEEAIVFEE
jgi:hypothetical protein